jgi:hypothetical protein
MTIDEARNLQPGTPVHVSDGRPQPPKHHTRKLAAWQWRNFDGIVDRVELDSSLGATVTVGKPHKMAGVISVASVVPVSHVSVRT